jgi:hypothetical protein
MENSSWKISSEVNVAVAYYCSVRQITVDEFLRSIPAIAKTIEKLKDLPDDPIIE